MPTRHWGIPTIADKLGIHRSTIVQWIKRYANTEHPFPAPDVEIEDPGRIHRGWLPDRWPEIQQWHRSTTRLPGNPKKRTNKNK